VLNQLKSVHIIGVAGTLMGAFAAFLKRHGFTVTGSDQNVYPPMSDVLKNAGVQVFQGYKAENLTGLSSKPDLVIIGNVIRSDNPEARAAIDSGYKYSSLPEAMEKLLLQETCNVVVAGTHGKTTTSSLMAHVLVQLKQDPSFFIGGVSKDLPFSFNIGKQEKGSYFVLEGDEYDTAFWDKVPKFNHYLPDHVILTSVEYDHADIYPNMEAVVKAFEGLMSRIRKNGQLIACFDYDVVKQLTKLAKVPVISYGSSKSSGARYIPQNIRTDNQFTHFEIIEDGKKVDEVSISMPGHHNVMNALSVWIECKTLNLAMNEVKASLKSFQGVKRRQEVSGEVQGVTVIDDFAHHPTAVRETLRALKAKYSKRRLIAVFEPRSATSRRKVFQKDYADAFSEADVIFIATPYDQSRIAAQDQFSSEMLIDDLKRKNKTASLMVSVDAGVVEVAKQSASGDVVAVLSNGGFEGFISKLLNQLRSTR
jgi:UDP-N-acetylmuramate: L-alanyl-gamma-D-glutamyl-meso-diaminopimelate ligase